jgi:hypothetical protein
MRAFRAQLIPVLLVLALGVSSPAPQAEAVTVEASRESAPQASMPASPEGAIGGSAAACAVVVLLFIARRKLALPRA